MRLALLLSLLPLAACAPKTGAPAATPTPSAAASPAQVMPSVAPTATPTPVAVKSTPSPTPIPMPSAMSELSPAADEDALPAAALIWSSEAPLTGDKIQIMTKDGKLQKTPPPSGDADQTGFFPYEIDYWGITRTDIGAALDPFLGHQVRIEGWYRKTYDHGVWHYEVDPQKITVLK